MPGHRHGQHDHGSTQRQGKGSRWTHPFLGRQHMGRAGAMGGGMRVQAPPGVFFRIPWSHFFLYMRVDIAVYRSGHEITGVMEK